ncbi:integrase arm-type DNA-binding domain-containing protein [Bradyrhizobium sp. Pear77]|uniref:tyrosine-type recombinase/integrase n=1 Tax=Bradyrhizobium TaxID=374 RepID=UPI001E46DFF1|nr:MULTISPECIES: integrase arm-type DNA-binding domain-containing protein [Bradyrhizobium]MCC8957152.1 integrase arm-type DNA-binding domain-containing protein [Bradyrhizobium altum]MCC8968628.1 integrase arm-type DNA-binding domain-containing protein [Bradyrhizobium oropedii]
MTAPTNQLTLTDAVVRNATLPFGKAQHYLHDDKLPGLAMRMRATGGRTWVYLFTKPGVRGTQRKTLGPWPKYNEKAARKAATIAAGEVVKGMDPNEAKREARRQQAAEKQRTTLAELIVEDGPYQTSLTGRQVVNWKPAMSALRRGLKEHAESGVGDLTRRQIMAAVDKVTKTGKRGAAKDLRKHTHTFLEWCVGEGYVDHNVLAGYREPKETRAQRVGRRMKGRALTDEEIIKVWHAAGKLGTFGLLTRTCLLGGPRRSEPTLIEWQKHIMDDRITFDAAWTKMGLHHDVPRTHLVDEVLAAAKHFQRATSDYVFPSPKTGGQMSGFTKMVNRLVKEAGVAKFTMHDLRRSLRTIMSRCGYDNEIQRLCVGQKPGGIDQVYNHDEQWIIRKMAFEAAHDYIAELVGAMRVGKVVRLQRTNPLDPIKAELLGRLREHYAAETA